MKGLSIPVGPFIFSPSIEFKEKTLKLLRYRLPSHEKPGVPDSNEYAIMQA
jgi:hypothetical protein